MSDNIVQILMYASVLIGNTWGFRYAKRRMAKIEADVKIMRLWQQRRDAKDVQIFILDENYDKLKLVEEVVNKIGRKYHLFKAENDDDIPHGKNIYIIYHYLSKVGVDGLQVLAKIKEKNEGNFVISFTGTKNDMVISNYIIGHIDRFVYKDNPDWERMLEKAVNDGIAVVLH